MTRGAVAGAWLRLSFGSWTPVWKVRLPFQLAGKEGTPSSGILWGEGKGTVSDPVLDGFPSGFLGQPYGDTEAVGGRFFLRVMEMVAEGSSWTWRESLRREAEPANVGGVL